MAPKTIHVPEKDRVCINPKCEYYNKVGTMVKAGESGPNDNFQCRKCRKGYSATYGTIFHGKHVEAKEIIQVLKSLAEGNSIRGSERIFGHHRDTIISWLKEAGAHCEKFEKEVGAKFNFSQIQIDELWSFIVKKTTPSLGKDTKKQKL